MVIVDVDSHALTEREEDCAFRFNAGSKQVSQGTDVQMARVPISGMIATSARQTVIPVRVAMCEAVVFEGNDRNRRTGRASGKRRGGSRRETGGRSRPALQNSRGGGVCPRGQCTNLGPTVFLELSGLGETVCMVQVPRYLHPSAQVPMYQQTKYRLSSKRRCALLPWKWATW